MCNDEKIIAFVTNSLHFLKTRIHHVSTPEIMPASIEAQLVLCVDTCATERMNCPNIKVQIVGTFSKLL